MFDEPIITSLYVHVPFCAKKCSYCAFYSDPSTGEIVNRYVNAVVREMELVANDLKPRTIFFGGGTPSILNLRQWETVLKAMERLGLTGAQEWTVECNPATVSGDKAKLLRDFGVNRVSMGVQSLDETLLDKLGRIHSREQVFKSFDILREAGFDNLNLDLMFAIPGQTMEIWRDTLREIMAMGSEHLSSYEVIYEEDTALFHDLQQGKIAVDEELACAMYEELLDASQRAGFRQYEIANFAKDPAEPRALASGLNADAAGSKPLADARGSVVDVPSRACQHNVNYWRGGSFYGLGPSAAGFVRGVRTKNWSNTTLYCEQLEKGQRAIESKEQLPPLQRAGELAAFGLRMNSGWPLVQFKQRTGFDLRQEWSAEIQQMVRLGYGTLDEERFHLTRQGMRYADWAAELFLKV